VFARSNDSDREKERTRFNILPALAADDLDRVQHFPPVEAALHDDYAKLNSSKDFRLWRFCDIPQRLQNGGFRT